MLITSKKKNKMVKVLMEIFLCYAKRKKKNRTQTVDLQIMHCKYNQSVINIYIMNSYVPEKTEHNVCGLEFENKNN